MAKLHNSGRIIQRLKKGRPRKLERFIGVMRWECEAITRLARHGERMGIPPVIIKTGKRFRLNMISSLTNQGKLRFLLFKQSFLADVFIDFMSRLIKYNRRKVFLIVDGHPSYKAKVIRAWLEDNQERIELFFLPAYIPELYYDELVNQDVKTNDVGRHRTLNVDQLSDTVTDYLYKGKNDSQSVRNYFHGKHVRYAS